LTAGNDPGSLFHLAPAHAVHPGFGLDGVLFWVWVSEVSKLTPLIGK